MSFHCYYDYDAVKSTTIEYHSLIPAYPLICLSTNPTLVTNICVAFLRCTFFVVCWRIHLSSVITRSHAHTYKFSSVHYYRTVNNVFTQLIRHIRKTVIIISFCSTFFCSWSLHLSLSLSLSLSSAFQLPVLPQNWRNTLLPSAQHSFANFYATLID